MFASDNVGYTEMGIVVVAIAALLHIAVSIKHLFDKPTGKHFVTCEDFDRLRDKVDGHHDRLALTVLRDDLKIVITPLEDRISNLRDSLEDMHRSMTRDLHENIARIATKLESNNRIMLKNIRFKGTKDGTEKDK